MPEPLKNLYTDALIHEIAEALHQRAPHCSVDAFVQHTLQHDWKTLELKQRMRRLTEALHVTLQLDYADALDILCPLSSQFSGFLFMFFPGYVELYGQKEWVRSMDALKSMTLYSSSEFAVRPFILAEPDRTLERMYQWSQDENEHVRRLASEGSRPRLPWAIGLPFLKQDPTPTFRILDALRDDPSEYVRRSVANHLNDISKTHPECTLEIAQEWLSNASNERRRLVKHGCRTLLKQGHSEAMQLFGFTAPTTLYIDAFELESDTLSIGETLTFSFRLASEGQALGKIRVEYGVYYKKARGSLSKKVFKITEVELQESERTFTRKHSFKDLSTRKHYPGEHRISILVNGYELDSASFTLSDSI